MATDAIEFLNFKKRQHWPFFSSAARSPSLNKLAWWRRKYHFCSCKMYSGFAARGAENLGEDAPHRQTSTAPECLEQIPPDFNR